MIPYALAALLVAAVLYHRARSSAPRWIRLGIAGGIGLVWPALTIFAVLCVLGAAFDRACATD